jgi:hypothetical protein
LSLKVRAAVKAASDDWKSGYGADFPTKSGRFDFFQPLGKAVVKNDGAFKDDFPQASHIYTEQISRFYI